MQLNGGAEGAGLQEELVAAARSGILDLFPDKESTYELILAPRFARLLDEFAGPRPSLLPFRKP